VAYVCTQCGESHATYPYNSRCSKCGYSLPTQESTSPAESVTAVEPGSWIPGLGTALFLAGTAGGLYFLFGFETSVSNSGGVGPDRIINMGLANDRAVGVTFSSALMIVGAVFMARR
jgi:hypothetical protein